MSLLKTKMQHIESISVMPAVTGQATGRRIPRLWRTLKDGVALNPEGRVTLGNVAKQACRKLSKENLKAS